MGVGGTGVVAVPTIAGVGMATRKAANLARLLFRQRSFL